MMSNNSAPQPAGTCSLCGNAIYVGLAHQCTSAPCPQPFAQPESVEDKLKRAMRARCPGNGDSDDPVLCQSYEASEQSAPCPAGCCVMAEEKDVRSILSAITTEDATQPKSGEAVAWRTKRLNARGHDEWIYYEQEPHYPEGPVQPLYASPSPAQEDAERLSTLIRRIECALLPDPNDERDISIEWLRKEIRAAIDAARSKDAAREGKL